MRVINILNDSFILQEILDGIMIYAVKNRGFGIIYFDPIAILI